MTTRNPLIAGPRGARGCDWRVHGARAVGKGVLLLLVTVACGCMTDQGTGAPALAVTAGPVVTATPGAQTTATAVSPMTQTNTTVASPTVGSVTAEEYFVYDAVLGSGFARDGVQLLVIKDHTGIDLATRQPVEGELERVQEHLGSSIELETVNDFGVKNRRAHALERHLCLDIPYVLLSEIELNEVLDTDEGWDLFYVTYPNSRGIITLSRVGFNGHVDQALVYVGNQAHYRAGIGYYLLLSKEAGVWVVGDRVLAWIS